MTPKEFSYLLQMVVDTTYFRFNGQLNEKTYGMAMGSPLSPVLMNLFMEEFEEKDITKALHPTKGPVRGLPYMKWVVERLQRAYNKHDIQLFCKARYTIRNVVV